MVCLLLFFLPKLIDCLSLSEWEKKANGTQTSLPTHPSVKGLRSLPPVHYAHHWGTEAAFHFNIANEYNK